ncbi:MAG: hypothetical protein GY811_28605 [Myxococcales bacterium]|nr:hypothetical protein [Myxococcales bacterium]
MSRRFPRVLARFAATVQIRGLNHTLICRTRDISMEGCFLETSELMAPGAVISLAVMDNHRGEVVSVEGHVIRMLDGPDRGIGVRLDDPLDDWGLLVERFQQAGQAERERPNLRLSILVVSSEENRRGALALYVTSGWDIRFAGDAAGAIEAMDADHLDAVICEFAADDTTWERILRMAREKHPNAKRLVRCQTTDMNIPESGADDTVHRFVETEHGMDALVDALTAEPGEPKIAMTDPITGALPLSDSAARELFRDVLSQVREKNESIAVFDLDSTLLDNGARQAAILREYGTNRGIKELMESKAEHWVTWDVGEAMANAGLPSDKVAVHREPFKAYWRDRFFTSEYCVQDEMVLGACAFVQAIREYGGKVFYVTGRHEEMRAGTVTCLERLGFPVPETKDVQLLMKPNLVEDDDLYKLRTYEVLSEHGTVVAAFDNEPTHINGYRRAFPEAYSIHLATDHSGRDVKLIEGVISVSDFASHG